MKSLLLAVVIALSSVAGSQAAGIAHPAASNRESVELVFDRNKGAIYALYGRELRKRPRLQGRITLGIEIGAAGVPTRCRVISSELHAPEFENNLCELIKQFRVPPQTPITFEKILYFFPVA